MLQTLVKKVGDRVKELRGASMLNAKEKALEFSAASHEAHAETLRLLELENQYCRALEKRLAEVENRLGIRHG